MRHALRLGEFEPVAPEAGQHGHPQAGPDVRMENRRLMREAKRRMARLASKSASEEDVSSVARAMQAHAKELRSETDVRQAILAGDGGHRWPRPRLLALIMVITLAAIVPTVTLRLLIWTVVLLLLTAVLLGPERARDAVYAVARHMSQVWGLEIGILRRLVDRITS